MTKKINPNLTAEQKLILFEEGTERAGSSELNIDLSDLASGIYMVRLTADEGTRTMRVAVQR